MTELSNYELITINGGDDGYGTPPVVSNDPATQAGYSIGYRFGRAIGQAVEDTGIILGKVTRWLDNIF